MRFIIIIIFVIFTIHRKACAMKKILVLVAMLLMTFSANAYVIDLTKDGVALGCATICINPGYMDLCEPLVKGSETMLCPVCDFPFGTISTESKVIQIEIVAKYDKVSIHHYSLINFYFQKYK